MNTLTIVSILMILILSVNFSEQKSQFVNCPGGHKYFSDPKIRDGCYKVFCANETSGGSYVIPCQSVVCNNGKPVNRNIDKVYPECCDTECQEE